MRLTAAAALPAGAGAFTLSGQAAVFDYHRAIQGAAGAFAFAGNDAALKRACFLRAGAGHFAYVGSPTFNPYPRLYARPGTFNLTGFSANLEKFPIRGRAAFQWYQASTTRTSFSLANATVTSIETPEVKTAISVGRREFKEVKAHAEIC